MHPRDGLPGGLHHLRALLGFFAGGPGGVGGQGGVAGDLHDRGVHLVHGGGGFGHAGALHLGPGAYLLGLGGQFLRGVGEVPGYGGGFAGHPAHGFHQRTHFLLARGGRVHGGAGLLGLVASLVALGGAVGQGFLQPVHHGREVVAQQAEFARQVALRRGVQPACRHLAREGLQYRQRTGDASNHRQHEQGYQHAHARLDDGVHRLHESGDVVGLFLVCLADVRQGRFHGAARLDHGVGFGNHPEHLVQRGVVAGQGGAALVAQGRVAGVARGDALEQRIHGGDVLAGLVRPLLFLAHEEVLFLPAGLQQFRVGVHGQGAQFQGVLDLGRSHPAGGHDGGQGHENGGKQQVQSGFDPHGYAPL